ncbi:MAG: hypothetical protein Q8O38_14625 [Sulfurimicrobium sp.]|nr:hypothetical protein [Sulfurimicrobium sp.]
MADFEFKSKPISFQQGWVPNTSGSVIGEHQYKPDRSFKDENGDVVCVIESTSTNDRKVGVGELCLADKFFADSGVSGILLFSLCGKSKHPPSPSTQAQYLEPYFRHLKSIEHPHGVKEVYFISEEDFESLNWVALDASFVAKAKVLKVSQ